MFAPPADIHLPCRCAKILRGNGWFAAEGFDETDLLNQLDIVALATTLMCSVQGINRAFVRQGVRKLERLSAPVWQRLARLARAEPPLRRFIWVSFSGRASMRAARRAAISAHGACQHRCG